MPTFSPAGMVPTGLARTRRRGSRRAYSSAISRVPSRESASTTMISIASVGYVCASTASRHGPSAVRSFRTGMITDTRGRDTGGVSAGATSDGRSARRGIVKRMALGARLTGSGEDLDQLLDVLASVEALEDEGATARGHRAARPRGRA